MKAKGINLLMLFAAVLVTGMLAVNAQEALYSNGDLTLLDNCSSDEIKGVVQDFHLCIGKKKIGGSLLISAVGSGTFVGPNDVCVLPSC